MKKFLCLVLSLMLIVSLVGCTEENTNSATNKEKTYTEKVKKQSLASIGLPNVKNFFEMGQLKTIYELRDDPDTICYWYIMNSYSGKWVYQGKCVGYGIPYSTQITNPSQVIERQYQGVSTSVIDQAEPNGLYSTGSTNATWILQLDSKGKIRPAYVEAEVYVTPIELTQNIQK